MSVPLTEGLSLELLYWMALMRFSTWVGVLFVARVIVKTPLPDPPLVVTPLGNVNVLASCSTSPVIPSVT